MIGLRVHFELSPGLTTALGAFQSPRINKIFRESLLEGALEIQRVAAQEKIMRGGVKGRGKNKTISPPLPDKLTSRSGDLRRSIKVDRSELPFAIEIGTELVYGRAHELGYPPRNLPARPFLGPAVEDVAPKFETFFFNAVMRAVGL